MKVLGKEYSKLEDNQIFTFDGYEMLFIKQTNGLWIAEL